MITRPDPAAGKAENAALERLAQLRALIREPQPISDAEVKTDDPAMDRRRPAGLVRALGRSRDDARLDQRARSPPGQAVPVSYL